METPDIEKFVKNVVDGQNVAAEDALKDILIKKCEAKIAQTLKS